MEISNHLIEFELPNAADFTEKCIALYALLTEANSKFNLTRIDSEEGFWCKHVYDSLAIVRYFPFLKTNPLPLADIGCGAGFPALILAAAFPHLAVTAIDSAGKKITFVAEAAKKLGLKNLTAVNGRSTELARKVEWKGKFQVITARAVGSGVIIYADANRMLASGGKFILYKTPNQAEEELPLLRRVKPERKWRMSENFELPDNAGSRTFLYF